MNMVDQIARRNAEQAVKDGLTQVAAIFGCEAEWMRAAGPRFGGVLVGKGSEPKFSADVIGKAFDGVCEERKFRPKPADVAELARALAPLRPMQKAHSDPMPRDRGTPEQREANKARIKAMQAFLESQEPEFRRALNEHGYGTPGLFAVQEKHRRELRTFIENSM